MCVRSYEYSAQEGFTHKLTGGTKSFNASYMKCQKGPALVIMRLFDLVNTSFVSIKASITHSNIFQDHQRVRWFSCGMSSSFATSSFAPGHTSPILEIVIFKRSTDY